MPLGSGVEGFGLRVQIRHRRAGAWDRPFVHSALRGRRRGKGKPVFSNVPAPYPMSKTLTPKPQNPKPPMSPKCHEPPKPVDFRVQGAVNYINLGFRVLGLGFRVLGLGLGVWGLGFRV